jgi:ankyrin repeat protein
VRAQDPAKAAQRQKVLDGGLIRAVRSHNLPAVRELLAEGASPNAHDENAKPDRNGTVQPPATTDKPTALLVVFDDARVPTGKQENGAPQTRLRSDPSRIVQALIEKGADPNVVDYDGTYPLLKAVQDKYAASARLLLEHHANPNQTWLHGITPLHVAVGNKDVATVKALLAAGGNRDARSAFDDPAHPLSDRIDVLLRQGNGSRR